jgi:hypothetical protein
MLRPTAVENAIGFFNDSNVIKVHWPVCVVNKNGEKTGLLFPKSTLPEGDMREIAFQLESYQHHKSTNKWQHYG